MAAIPAEAQRTDRSTASVSLGALAGGVVGLVGGGFAGASFSSRDCETGNQDACLGEAFPGFVWGAGAGMTVGIPLGADLANNRAGSFAKTLGVSALIFGAEIIALNSPVDDGRTKHKGLTFGIAAVTPVVQMAAGVVVERAELGKNINHRSPSKTSRQSSASDKRRVARQCSDA